MAEEKYMTEEQRKNEHFVASVLIATIEQYGKAILDCGCEIGETTTLPTLKVIRSGWCFNTYPDFKGRYWTYCNACVRNVMPVEPGEIVSMKAEIIFSKAEKEAVEKCNCDPKCDPCVCGKEGKC